MTHLSLFLTLLLVLFLSGCVMFSVSMRPESKPRPAGDYAQNEPGEPFWIGCQR